LTNGGGGCAGRRIWPAADGAAAPAVRAARRTTKRRGGVGHGGGGGSQPLPDLAGGRPAADEATCWRGEQRRAEEEERSHTGLSAEARRHAR
jgi:hypothetical protein